MLLVDSMNGGIGMKRMGNGLYRFYLPDTGPGSRMDRLASALIDFREIKEIIISDASDGYLVKARFFAGMEPKGKEMDRFVRRVERL